VTSREQILARIRAALPADDTSQAAIPRTYRHEGQLTTDERIELLSDRLFDYGCDVHVCKKHEIAQSITALLKERGKTRLVASADIPGEWLAGDFGSGGLTYRELDGVEGIVTGCALAVASTGTIVLRHDASTGSRALTLIPDYHLCIVFEEQVVELVPEAIRGMAAFAPAPMTTISGPSATSDIEMTRIQGVHGPRTLDVLIVR
jgi:L-lactate dehydrogenase complex protein LldG